MVASPHWGHGNAVAPFFPNTVPHEMQRASLRITGAADERHV